MLTRVLSDLYTGAFRNVGLTDRGQLSEFALARLAGRSDASDAAEHRANADRVEFELLREIADAVPELTVAVWQLAGQLGDVA